MAAGEHQRILSCLVRNGVVTAVTAVTAVHKTGPMVTTGTRGLSHPPISLSTSFLFSVASFVNPGNRRV